ncbi:hypothetical protein Pmani_007381 [Petrolisthes manimaculis]|uniref:Uncharacterized protein n=1 Tax=Petrolisthes manimaculis TaxID=1843537 RepID=A0AAE1UKU7_9EUCA|nr:hypothetical protein Pmani_007381 [Petrolisthes manimaculis]
MQEEEEEEEEEEEDACGRGGERCKHRQAGKQVEASSCLGRVSHLDIQTTKNPCSCRRGVPGRSSFMNG